MCKLPIFFVTLMIATISLIATASAAPDQYMGDTAIYSGASTYLRPNVLLIIDNSNATLNPASGEAYNPNPDTPYATTVIQHGTFMKRTSRVTSQKRRLLTPQMPWKTCNASATTILSKKPCFPMGPMSVRARRHNPNIKNNSMRYSTEGQNLRLGQLSKLHKIYGGKQHRYPAQSYL